MGDDMDLLLEEPERLREAPFVPTSGRKQFEERGPATPGKSSARSRNGALAQQGHLERCCHDPIGPHAYSIEEDEEVNDVELCMTSAGM